jgi:ppGpp synthetase/RelA/SpoT-type nucleotidyltranferase
MKYDYAIKFPILEETARKLTKHLTKVLEGIERIDSINSRAKDPDRYFAKATKKYCEGSEKYNYPVYEIQDQIGARINVIYLQDVEIVRQHITKFFRFIEETKKSPEDNSTFGYFGHHFIIQMPDDIISEEHKEFIPEFFELQIKTLFQHAWSESHHDLGYKTLREWTSEERRKMAFTAAQAWGADQIFKELARDCVVNDNETI